LFDMCESIETCVMVLDTLATTTHHTIPALTDQQHRLAC